MLITISTTMSPATDLGYLLSKNPARAQQFELTYGLAHVFYPHATADLCTVALALDIDPIALVRGREGANGGGALDAYVNDRGYASCYLMSQAIRKIFASALAGKCKERPELVDRAIPLTCTVYALPCRQGPDLIRRLFEPLGYEVSIEHGLLDEEFPEWGESPYHKLTISGCTTLSLLLTQLVVLIPVLDNDRHKQADDEEVERLVKRGAGWLNSHPECGLIAARFLRYKDGLTSKALDQLAAQAAEEPEEDGEPTTSTEDPNQDENAQPIEPAGEEPVRLHQQRHQAVVKALKASGARSVIDLGCGDGKLLRRLLPEEQFQFLAGVEASQRCLGWARRNLNLRHRNRDSRIRLMQGSVTFRDNLMKGYQAAVSIEVIEHLDPERLDSFADVLFAGVRPQTAIITTPNVEYNVKFPNLKPGHFRHSDHRFEWTRAEFQTWCNTQATNYGYTVNYGSVGDEDPELGAPSQMAVFTLVGDASYSSPNPEDNKTQPDAEFMLRGGRITTSLGTTPIRIIAEKAQCAFEQVVRNVVDPRWLVYLPPTMSPCSTSKLPGMLEHPAEALDYYRRHGLRQVICEQKHMGSRAILIVCREPQVARRRFGLSQESNGVCYSRTGRPFFSNKQLESDFLEPVRGALSEAHFWERFATDWVALDCELMPWSAKAQGLLQKQYAPMGAAAELALPALIAELETCSKERGHDLSLLQTAMKQRLECAQLFRESYRRYCWEVNSVADYRLAPFHILATEGMVHSNKNHIWHMESLAQVALASDGMILATPYLVVDVNDTVQVETATRWWEDLTASGGEGMVVKPLDFIGRDAHGLLQPAIKCRGQEYLRIIYGPDYTMPKHLERLRQRGLQRKRALALDEFTLGLEGLQRFVRRASLDRVHECAFGVLALESEALDPRL